MDLGFLKHSKEKESICDRADNYKMLDVTKYVVAIFVICIHCNQLFPQEYLNFFIKNIVCRIAVPFFFISSAFFVRSGSRKNADYVKIYLKRLMKSYCLWSIVFIPIGLDWIHQNLSLAGYLLPFALLYGLIHIGTYYHLWYVPAAILTIYLVDRLLKNHSYQKLFALSIALFLFGSLESYYGLLPDGWFKDFFDIVIMIIFTTRSGLLYGMIFTLMGFYIYDHKDSLQKIQCYVPSLTLASALFLILEGSFLFTIERLDMNFLIMLVPFSFFFFLWILHSPYVPQWETKRLRNLSKYYYFVHPVCIVIIEEGSRALGLDILSSGVFSLLVVILLTHLLSSMTLTIQGPLKAPSLCLAGLSGMMITFMIASLVFFMKPENIMIKFEFVPCLWFFFSFYTYFLLNKKRSRQFSVSHI